MRRLLRIFAAIIGALLGLSRLLLRRETVDWRKASKPGRIAEVAGADGRVAGIHIIDEGSGPAVMLVHGFGGHTYSFHATIPDLARDHRVVALDLIGFGYSERPRDADYSLTAHATRVLAVMDKLGIHKASLIGHSMGGEVVMRVAAMAPDRVDKLVLAASVSGDRIPTLPPTPLVKPLLPLITRLMAMRALKRTFYDPRLATPEMRAAYTAPARLKGSVDALYAITRDSRKDKRIPYDRIRAPVLILWAAGEKILPRWSLSRLRRHFPKAEVVTVPEAGHLLLEEKPEACNKIIRRFLAGEPASDRAPESTTAITP